MRNVFDFLENLHVLIPKSIDPALNGFKQMAV